MTKGDLYTKEIIYCFIVYKYTRIFILSQYFAHMYTIRTTKKKRPAASISAAGPFTSIIYTPLNKLIN